MIETNFRKALISTGGFGNVIISFFTRPISLILLVLIILTYAAQSKIMKLEEQ
jgi:TctA family transporter